MFGAFDDVFDFNGDGNLDELEKATEIGFVMDEVLDENEGELWDSDDDHDGLDWDSDDDDDGW